MITQNQVEAAAEAYWNAIPCHVPWDKYDNEAGKNRTRLCMLEALKAAQQAGDDHNS